MTPLMMPHGAPVAGMLQQASSSPPAVFVSLGVRREGGHWLVSKKLATDSWTDRFDR